MNGVIKQKVIVILPVFNQSRTVGECIRSLLRQTHRDFEIWVGDDGSSDNTREIVSTFPVKMCRFEHQGKAKTLNKLLSLVEADYIAVVEGDAIYEPNYLEVCIRHFSTKQVGGVIGRQLAVKSNRLVSRAISAYREVRWSLVDRPKYVESTAWVFRREALEDVGGFNEEISIADDAAMGISLVRHGWRIVFEPKTVWYHHEPNSLWTFMRQQFRWGIGSYTFMKKYGRTFANPHVRMRWKTLLSFYGFLFLSVIALFFYRAGLFALASIASLYLLFRTTQFTLNARKVTKDTTAALLFPTINLLGKVAFSIGFLFGCLGTSL